MILSSIFFALSMYSIRSAAFFSALGPLQWLPQVEKCAGRSSNGLELGTCKRKADNRGRFWWSSHITIALREEGTM